MSHKSPKPSRRVRLAYLFVALLITVIGLVVANYSRTKLVARSGRHFQEDTSLLTSILVDRADTYNEILLASRSFLYNTSDVTQDSWTQYFKDQRMLKRYPGISTILYLEVVTPEEVPELVARQRQVPFFGPNFNIKPAGIRPEYAIATLVRTNNDVSNGLGFDNFSTQARKETYKSAEARNKSTLSEPLQLITGFQGFLITLPVYESPGKAAGFVAITFRTEDFITALYGQSLNDNMASRISDVTDKNNELTLYETANWNSTSSELTRSDIIDIGGREWKLQYKAAVAYDDTLLTRYIPGLIIIGSVIIIVALSLSYGTYSKSRELKHYRAKQSPAGKK